MATRDNQSLQILVIGFAIVSVLAVGATLFINNQWKASKAEVASLKGQADDQRKAMASAQTEANRYKVLMGFSENEELAPIEEAYAKDIESFANGIPEEIRAYRKIAEYLDTQLANVNEREAKAKADYQDIKDKYESHQKIAKEEIDESKKRMDEIDKDAQAERKKHDDERQTIRKEAEALAAQLAKLKVEVAQKITAADQSVAEVTKANNRLQRNNAKLNLDLDAVLNPLSFEVADGSVVFANQRDKTVWIDLGHADGLTRQVSFSVFSADENDAAAATKKASIEVTRIIDAHLSEASIVEDTPSDPMVAGDKVYSPVWHRGRRESFALSGLMDIDGDGESDRDRIRELIRINGGVIDAELLEEPRDGKKRGEILGEMTTNTHFLIRGEAFTEKSQKLMIDNSSKLERQAQELGVKRISLDNFLDHIGWEFGERTLEFGSGAKASEIRPESRERKVRKPRHKPSPHFRRRSPPRRAN